MVNKKTKGFTIIELAISSAILTVVFGGISIFGIQTIRGFQRSQALKNTIENASYAIESINKLIRTSHDINGDSSEIFIIDNDNASESYCYRFTADKLERGVGPGTAASCAGVSSFSDIVGGGGVEVTGSFNIKETNRASNERGLVRTNLILSYPVDVASGFEADEITIQSSVSLRDYGYEGTLVDGTPCNEHLGGGSFSDLTLPSCFTCIGGASHLVPPAAYACGS